MKLMCKAHVHVQADVPFACQLKLSWHARSRAEAL